MSPCERSAVVLFRDPARGDAYHAALADSHSVVDTIPVLEHQGLLSARDVGRIVGEHGGGRAYAAIVFTSQNSVRVLGQAAAEWTGAGSPAASGGDRSAQWREFIGVPIFAVGKATGDACRALLPGLAASGPAIRGEACGSAAALAPEIARFCGGQRGGRPPRLAFFCGDQRRDTLPRAIAQSGCAELCEIPAYTTAARRASDVQAELAAVLGRCSARRLWLVLFSPSGARAVVPVVRRLALQGVLSTDAVGPGVVCRFAAIGGDHGRRA
ncbi:uroporphyrinogen-III synthase, partial [Coemansia helicoidea]